MNAFQNLLTGKIFASDKQEEENSKILCKLVNAAWWCGMGLITKEEDNIIYIDYIDENGVCYTINDSKVTIYTIDIEKTNDLFTSFEATLAITYHYYFGLYDDEFGNKKAIAFDYKLNLREY